MPRKYGKKAQKTVERAMHNRKRGTLKSGKRAVRESRAESRQSPSDSLKHAKKAQRFPRKSRDYFFFFDAFAPSLPKAVRVSAGRFAIVRFLLAD